MDNPPETSVPTIPPGTPPTSALWYAIKGLFPSTASKIGIWRPVIVAVMAYMGWDKHVDHRRHEERFERLESFVQSPPTNGRRIHEVAYPPLPNTNIIIRRK